MVSSGSSNNFFSDLQLAGNIISDLYKIKKMRHCHVSLSPLIDIRHVSNRYTGIYILFSPFIFLVVVIIVISVC